MKNLISLTLVFLAISCKVTSDFKACTKDSHAVTDDLFNIIFAIENNPWDIQPAVIQSLLANVQNLLGDCANIQIDLKRFDSCAEILLSAIPDVRLLIQSVKEMNLPDIVTNSARIVLEVYTGMLECTRHREQINSLSRIHF